MNETFPSTTVSLTKHPATLPQEHIPDDIDTDSITAIVLPHLLNLEATHLAQNAIWRDLLALTGTFRTFYDPDVVAKTWRYLCKTSTIQNLAVTPGTAQVLRFGPKACWLQVGITFDTDGVCPAKCSGSLGLVPHDGTWKIWLITTVLEQPHGFPDVDKLEPGTPDPNSNINNNEPLDCIVVGAAVAGLSMAGRLKSLGLSYKLLEQHASIGDIWTKARYESVKLHTSRDFNQLPGQPKTFTADDPYHLNSADLARGFQKYVKTFGINVSTGTKVVGASYDAASKTWTVEAQRHGETTITLKAHHLVLATGSRGTDPITPKYADRETYTGTVLHAIDWKTGLPWQNKRGIVIGSANTAHDIIADMVRANFQSVTLVQRSKTFVLPMSTFSALVDPVYRTEIPSEVSDRLLLNNPLPVQRLVAMEGIRACADLNPAYFDKLEAQGYLAERYGDLWGLIYDREGGHFFDVGSGELIADGRVKVKSDALPVAHTETGLRFSDGSELEADVVVFATGYESDIRKCAARIVGEDVARNLEEFWQCDSEGETRGAWRDTGRKCKVQEVHLATYEGFLADYRDSQILPFGTRAMDTLMLGIIRDSSPCASKPTWRADRYRSGPVLFESTNHAYSNLITLNDLAIFSSEKVLSFLPFPSSCVGVVGIAD